MRAPPTRVRDFTWQSAPAARLAHRGTRSHFGDALGAENHFTHVAVIPRMAVPAPSLR